MKANIGSSAKWKTFLIKRDFSVETIFCREEEQQIKEKYQGKIKHILNESFG